MKLCGFWMRPCLHLASSEYKQNKLKAVCKRCSRSWNEASHKLFPETWIMTNSPVLKARVRPNCIWEKVTLSQYFHIIVECFYVGPVLPPTVWIQHRYNWGWWTEFGLTNIIFELLLNILDLPIVLMRKVFWGSNMESIYTSVFVCMYNAPMYLYFSVPVFALIHRCSRRKIMNASE